MAGFKGLDSSYETRYETCSLQLGRQQVDTGQVWAILALQLFPLGSRPRTDTREPPEQKLQAVQMPHVEARVALGRLGYTG